jgi:N-acylneuraminate cytidylyltransferase
MKDKVAFFLPTRKGSLRVLNKNTRQFSKFSGGLLENKLIQLQDSMLIDEVILSTNDYECIEIASKFVEKYPKIRIVERPEELCLDTTNLKDLITYVPTITQANYILWGHVTTPLFDGKCYDEAIAKFFEAISLGFDSLITVTEFKNFLLDQEGRVVNNTTDIPWPRTQDLKTLFEINHAVFLTSRNNYVINQNRVGDKPFLFVSDKIKSIDIDWEDDFKIAELLYEKYYGL